MNKKVLVFADPNSIHTKKWVDGWKFISYDVILSGLSDKSTNNIYIINENINTTGGNGFKYIKNILNFRKILKEVKPTIINAHYMSSYGLISALIKRKKDLLILSLHGSDVMIDMNRNIIYSLLTSYILNKSDILVSVSQTMTNLLLKKSKKLESKILTQQYGVDIKLLNQFYSEKKDIDIVTNRQWKENSNYPVILKAISYFSDKNIKLIGSDSSDYANNLLNQFKDITSFSTGLIPYEENLAFVGRSKIFISLTSSDGIPLSLVEAMYLGAIPIVSDIAPNRELIKDGVNGYATSIDAGELKETVDKVLKLDERKIKKIQEYNKALVLGKFDFEKNFNKLKNEVEKITND